MKRFLLTMCLIAFAAAGYADDIKGFWKTVDEKTGKQQSIVAIYENGGKYYGRLIVTFKDDGSINDTIYNAVERAPAVQGNPYYVGLDFIWDLKHNGKKYVDGSIMDPQKGYIYGAQMWRDGNNLIVRGELLFLGRNQTWPPAHESDFPPGFQKPDTSKFVPVIPVAKR